MCTGHFVGFVMLVWRYDPTTYFINKTRHLACSLIMKVATTKGKKAVGVYFSL